MSSLPITLPHGSQNQQAAAWELVVASVILLSMFIYRLIHYGKGSITIGRSPYTFFRNLMNESGWPHTFLYFVLAALVISATVLQWF